MGVDDENIRRLRAGMPLRIDLRPMGGTDLVLIDYAPTLQALAARWEQTIGPLPDETPWPGGDPHVDG